ncbi:MAG: sulfotransferase [Phycisphaerae bacterium]
MIVGKFDGFFIGGCDRSGTSLLQCMLNAHPNILITHEVAAAVTWHGKYGRMGPEQASGMITALTKDERFIGVTPDMVWQELADRPATFANVLSAVYRSLAAIRGKRLWGDKSPRYCLHFGFLAETFPQSALVHIYRDPRAVAYSLIRQSWGPDTAYHAALHWQECVQHGLNEGRLIGPARFLNVCYEALVSDPSGQLERICLFLGVDMDRRMLDVRNQEEGLVPAVRDFHPLIGQPITTQQIDKWKRLPARDIAAIEAICGKLMDELGYEQVSGKGERGVSFGGRLFFGIQARCRRFRRRMNSVISRARKLHPPSAGRQCRLSVQQRDAVSSSGQKE